MATRVATKGGFRPPAEAGEATEGRLLLGRYRMHELIGAGGHGAVWRAVDERLRREVAVKVISHGVAGGGARVEREALAAARLNHPGIVALFELGVDEAAVYLVSELVRGRTLSELEADGALSDRDVADIGLALCEALAHAHRQGVVHRDVKPQNVIVAAEPAAGQGFVKLTDFGVARLTSEEPLTATGGVVGTPAYMAPEQAAGEEATHAADVYALALVLYEAWVGERPPAVTVSRRRRAAARPRPLSAARRDLPRELCMAIDAALDARAEHRPTLEQLANALESALGELSDADGIVSPGPLDRLRARVRRPTRANPPGPPARLRAGLAGGLLTLLALIVVTPHPPVSPVLAAAGMMTVCALFPRGGWAGGALALCVWLASPAGDSPGTAAIVACALIATGALLPRAGPPWAAATLAPALAAASLAAAFPALAGLARAPLRRAGLAAAGLVWVAVAAALGWAPAPLGGPAKASSLRDVESSLDAGLEVLASLMTSGDLLVAGLWAVLAAALPLALRWQSVAARVVGIVAWGAAALAGHVATGDLLRDQSLWGADEGLAAGIAVGCAVAFALAAARRKSHEMIAERRPAGEAFFRRMPRDGAGWRPPADEHPAKPGGEDRGPRRGSLRTRVQVAGAARRAGAEARQGDG